MRAILFGLLVLLAPAWATSAAGAAGAAEGSAIKAQPSFAPGRWEAAAPPSSAVAAPAPKSALRPAVARGTARTYGDGPAWVLNGFVLKEVAQCRQDDALERLACCERLLHPNACR